MSPYPDKNITRSKDNDPVQIWNKRWMEALMTRSPQEDLWTRSYNQVISKHNTVRHGHSNIYLSMSWAQKRAMESTLVMNLLGEKPFIRFKPNGQEDITNVKISEAFVSHFMSNADFFFEFLHLIQLVLIYGDAWMRFPWHVEYRDFDLPRPITDEFGRMVGFDHEHPVRTRLKTFEGIKYECRSPWRVIIDPAAYSPRPSRMRWMIDTDPRFPIERLYELADQGIFDKKEVAAIDEEGYQDAGLIQRANRGEDKWDVIDTHKKGLVFIRECYDFLTNERCVIANWDKKLTTRSKKLGLLGGVPYRHFGLHNMPLEPYSKGLPWQVEYYEIARNHLFNTMLDEHSYRTYAPYIVPPGSELARDQYKELRPGLKLVGRPDEYGVLDKPSHMGETKVLMADLEKEALLATGVTAESTGLTAAPGTTATTSSIANAELQKFARFVTLILSHSMGEMALHNNMTAWQFSSETVVEYLPIELEPEFRTVRGLYGQFGEAPAFNITYIPKDQSYTASQAERLNILIAMFDRAVAFMGGRVDPKSGQVIPNDLNSREYWSMMFREARISMWERLFNQPQTEQNPFQGLAFQRQQGQGLFSPSRPQSVPGGQGLGNILGQYASRLFPGSNNVPNASVDNLTGIQ